MSKSAKIANTTQGQKTIILGISTKATASASDVVGAIGIGDEAFGVK